MRIVSYYFPFTEKENKKKKKTRRIKFRDKDSCSSSEDLPQVESDHEEPPFELPQFGVSPGPTPSPSPPSTPQTPSIFSVSEVSQYLHHRP